jgi:putative copper resistance protein D
MDDVLVACRTVHFVSVMLAFGIAAFRYYALDGSDPAVLPALDVRLSGLLLVSAIVALLSGLALVPVIGSRMAGSASAALDLRTIAKVLLATSFGRVWCGHLLIAALLVVGTIRHVRSAYRAALAALLLASLGWVGHATIGEGAVALAHEINDSVHLLAGGIWLGGLVPLTALVVRARRSRGGMWLTVLRKALPQFSHMGYVAVGLLALTGVVNTIFLVGSIDALVEAPYGRLLLVKIALFLLLIAVAVINRFVLVPRINRESTVFTGIAALICTVGIEQTLALGILIVVSVIGTLPPAMHMHLH